MSERFASDLIFILVVLLVAAAIGFLIGYFIRRYFHLKFSQIEEEINSLKEWKKSAEEEHVHLMKRYTGCEGLIEKLRSDFESYKLEERSYFSAAEAMPEMVFEADAAAEVFGFKFEPDDLKIIEGIGEKIESILKSNGIESWWRLARTEPEKIKDILVNTGGPRYKMHEPRTWPEQALLAFQGKWSELKKYQDELNAGR
jgi:predicted flap endonuclease-1-like 5' DNA nuclease